MPRSVSRKTGIAVGLSVVSGAAMAAALMAPQASAADDPSAVFFREGYNFCDAKLMGAVWGLSFYKAKVEAGQKIIHNGDAGKKTLKDVLATGRRVQQCLWTDTPHNFAQMELLAAVWGISVPDAKTKVGQLYTLGKSAKVVNAINRGAPKVRTE